MIIKGTEKSSKGCWNAVALLGRYVDYNAVRNDDDDDKLTLLAIITIQKNLADLIFMTAL